MSNNLKPCPFCGQAPHFITSQNPKSEFPFVVRCPGDYCPIQPQTFNGDNADNVKTAWNQRHGELQVQDEDTNSDLYLIGVAEIERIRDEKIALTQRCQQLESLLADVLASGVEYDGARGYVCLQVDRVTLDEIRQALGAKP